VAARQCRTAPCSPPLLGRRREEPARSGVIDYARGTAPCLHHGSHSRTPKTAHAPRGERSRGIWALRDAVSLSQYRSSLRRQCRSRRRNHRPRTRFRRPNQCPEAGTFDAPTSGVVVRRVRHWNGLPRLIALHRRYGCPLPALGRVVNSAADVTSTRDDRAASTSQDARISASRQRLSLLPPAGGGGARLRRVSLPAYGGRTFEPSYGLWPRRGRRRQRQVSTDRSTRLKV
jgi:hypothetical protein